MDRWIWFKSIRLEHFLEPVPLGEEGSGPAENRDRRAQQAEMLALERLGRNAG